MISPRASVECTEQIIAEDTTGRLCPHDDLGLRPRTGTIEMSENAVPARNIESPYGGEVRSLPGAAVFQLGVHLCLCHQPRDLIWILGGWQSSGSRGPY